MKSMHEMTVNELRESGYAVVLFAPSELDGADPERVEDSLTDAAWDIISIHAEYGNETEDKS